MDVFAYIYSGDEVRFMEVAGVMEWLLYNHTMCPCIVKSSLHIVMWESVLILEIMLYELCLCVSDG